MDKVCKWCNKVINTSIGRVFSNHVRWCDKNPTKTNANISIGVNNYHDNKFGKLTSFEVTCNTCLKKFNIQEREFIFPKQKKYFCSISCANTRKVTQEQKEKTRQTINSKIAIGEIKKIQRETRKCLECNQNFQTRIDSKQIFCSKLCTYNNRKSDNEYITYRQECKFKFNVWKYPDKFDLDLIKKYGWYKPVNRGNNINGVSRDHKISIMYGWQNKIPSYIIAHPANCQLMKHSENIGKNKKCSISLENLTKLIEEWDKK